MSAPGGDVWKAAVYSRAGTQRRGCPVCAGVISGKRKLRYEKGLAELKEVVGYDSEAISALSAAPDSRTFK